MKLSEVKKYIIEEYGQGYWSTFKNDLTYRINKLSEQEQRELVHHRDYNLQYILNPSKELQLEMVRKDGITIKYINNPSERVQLEAVKENVFAIEQIHNPSDKVLQEAIKQIEKEEDSIGIYKILFRYLENDLKEKESKEDEV